MKKLFPSFAFFCLLLCCVSKSTLAQPPWPIFTMETDQAGKLTTRYKVGPCDITENNWVSFSAPISLSGNLKKYDTLSINVTAENVFFSFTGPSTMHRVQPGSEAAQARQYATEHYGKIVAMLPRRVRDALSRAFTIPEPHPFADFIEACVRYNEAQFLAVHFPDTQWKAYTDMLKPESPALNDADKMFPRFQKRPLTGESTHRVQITHISSTGVISTLEDPSWYTEGTERYVKRGVSHTYTTELYRNKQTVTNDAF